MRLVTYEADRGPRAGLLDGDLLVDVWDELGRPDGDPGAAGRGCSPVGLRAAIAADVLAGLAEGAGTGGGRSEGHGRTVPLSAARLLPPIPDPEKIVCIGLNYRAHATEAGLEPPEVPTFFAKFANALAAPGATVTLPAASAKVDFEAEVGFVIGRAASEVAVERALEHVAGYTLLNDLSARELQFATPQWMPGKVFDGSAPCGPALVSPEEAGDPAAIGIALDLNGERMQEASTADLIFGVPELLAHLSTLMTLVPGDIVATGTPAGVGSTRVPRVWLADGDEIRISSPQLGELVTRLAR